MLNPLVPMSPTYIDKKPPKTTTVATPSASDILKEAKAIRDVSLPMILTSLILYLRSLISLVFLGHLGPLPLAGGALAVCFANITGYSVLSGLASGMEPICAQSHGAHRFKQLGLALQRASLLLLLASLPISLLWLNMHHLLLLCGQDPAIAAAARSYILASLPDLAANSLLHPLRIYLRTQSITMPLAYCAALAVLLHIPITYLLVTVLSLGVPGVAAAAVITNLNLVLCILAYVARSGAYIKTWGGFSNKSLTNWGPLLNLAVPSCVSVCLEWWWYEIMILLCGLLANPRATVGSMGILIQTTSLIYIFPSSLSMGVSARVGNQLGAGRPQGARTAAVLGLCASFLTGIAALAFAVSVRNVWAGMFTGDAEIAALTAAVLPVIGLCELGNCPQTTGYGVLRGTARPRMGAGINVGCFYLVGMPVAVGLCFYLGYDFKGLWMGLLAAQASCAAAMLVVVMRMDWDEEASRAKELTGKADHESDGLISSSDDIKVNDDSPA
ncbi:hypothetical protein SASPL_109872 [Salvia splendens]|uniref:Protein DETOXIFICATION n=2 Tax=Salvia splendens TaxID=180675 RepID=A0A8X9A9M1_SALSN|nr:hypothetical protein SASPL_109872 [Salvia splendens]